MRGPDRRKFNGHWYELAGTHPEKSRAKLESWARFQRLENGYSIRIIKVKGGYEAYMFKTRRGIRGR